MSVAILAIVVLALAYANGANDNFKPCATVYCSRALSYNGALKLATVAQVFGSACSVVLAGALIRAFSGRGLVPDSVVANPQFIIAVGAGAAMAVGLATRFRLPVSTTHALIGGLAGSALALAPHELMWSALGSGYFLPLLMSPVLALGLAGALYPVASFCRKRLGVEAEDCICISPTADAVAMGSEQVMVHSQAAALEYEHCHDCNPMYRGSVYGISAQQITDTIHMGSAFALGFARGLNDTPKILGLLIVAGWSLGVSQGQALAVVALAMALGGLLHSRGLAETLGRRLTTMNPGQGLLANLVSSGLVIGASTVGLPVSTTHVSAGAMFGIGVWTGTTNWKVVGAIVLAWIATLPMGAVGAFLAATALGAIPFS